MEIEIRKVMVTNRNIWEEYESEFGLSQVFVNGRLAGYCPAKPADPNYGKFHPLSGFPQELVGEVVKRCEELTSSLPAPIPHDDITEDLSDDLEED